MDSGAAYASIDGHRRCIDPEPHNREEDITGGVDYHDRRRQHRVLLSRSWSGAAARRLEEMDLQHHVWTAGFRAFAFRRVRNTRIACKHPAERTEMSDVETERQHRPVSGVHGDNWEG